MGREKVQKKQINTKTTERHKERIFGDIIIFVQNHHAIIVIWKIWLHTTCAEKGHMTSERYDWLSSKNDD